MRERVEKIPALAFLFLKLYNNCRIIYLILSINKIDKIIFVTQEIFLISLGYDIFKKLRFRMLH